MLPKWAFGYWQSRERFHTMEELTQVAETYCSKGYPLDVMVQDWQYWGKYGWNAMKFDPEYAEDISSDIRKLKEELHVHLALSVWPNFGDEPENEAYQLFKESGYLLDDTAVLKQIGGDTVLLQGVQKNFMDMMNEDALDRYWQMMEGRFLEKGIDIWWLDANEPNLSSLQDTYHQYETMAGPAAEYLNLYSFRQCQKVYEGQRENGNDRRVCILSRSGYAGQQAFGATVWSGDTYGTWQVFRYQITAGLNLSLAGYPYWGCDIGGFVGNVNDDPKYRELYVRWFQFSVFTPIFRAHGSPDKTGREIWSFGEMCEGILDGHKSCLYYDAAGEILDVHVYGGENGAFTLYEDEGDGYRYEQGSYSEISFRWREETGELQIEARKGNYSGMPKTRKMCFIYHCQDSSVEECMEVSYTGEEIILQLKK